MEFKDKMIFLMDLTKTSNKMLASAMNVDPSMISLIRTGRRSRPRNLEHIKTMSSFLAARIQNTLPTDVITQSLNQINVTLKDGRRLDDLLFRWLCGTEDSASEVRVQKVIEELGKPYVGRRPLATNIEYANPLIAPTVFYGDEGTQEAIRAFFRHLLSAKTPGTLYMLNDTNSEWYLSNNELWQDTLLWIQELLQRGYRLVQILPSPSQNQFYDILIHWIPLYLTGQIEVYFYPRYRDQIFRNMIYLVPGQIVLTGSALAAQNRIEYTVVTKGEEFINANLNIFREYLHLCQRTIIPHRTSKEIQDCLFRYRHSAGNLIQLTNTLPSSTMPIASLHHAKKTGMTLDYPHDEYLRFLYDYQADMEKQRRNYTTVEMAPLAPAEIVASGRVQQQVPGLTITQKICYDCDAYRHHLKNIIRIMKENPNYFFLPMPYQEASMPNLFLRPDRMAILISPHIPIVLFEMNQPEMIRPFHQYLLDTAERMNFRDRQAIIGTLERECVELEFYIEKEEQDQ